MNNGNGARDSPKNVSQANQSSSGRSRNRRPYRKKNNTKGTNAKNGEAPAKPQQQQNRRVGGPKNDAPNGVAGASGGGGGGGADTGRGNGQGTNNSQGRKPRPNRNKPRQGRKQSGRQNQPNEQPQHQQHQPQPQRQSHHQQQPQQPQQPQQERSNGAPAQQQRRRQPRSQLQGSGSKSSKNKQPRQQKPRQSQSRQKQAQEQQPRHTQQRRQPQQQQQQREQLISQHASPPAQRKPPNQRTARGPQMSAQGASLAGNFKQRQQGATRATQGSEQSPAPAAQTVPSRDQQSQSQSRKTRGRNSRGRHPGPQPADSTSGGNANHGDDKRGATRAVRNLLGQASRGGAQQPQPTHTQRQPSPVLQEQPQQRQHQQQASTRQQRRKQPKQQSQQFEQAANKPARKKPVLILKKDMHKHQSATARATQPPQQRRRNQQQQQDQGYVEQQAQAQGQQPQNQQQEPLHQRQQQQQQQQRRRPPATRQDERDAQQNQSQSPAPKQRQATQGQSSPRSTPVESSDASPVKSEPVASATTAPVPTREGASSVSPQKYRAPGRGTPPVGDEPSSNVLAADAESRAQDSPSPRTSASTRKTKGKSRTVSMPDENDTARQRRQFDDQLNSKIRRFEREFAADACTEAFDIFRQLQGRKPDKVACKVLLMLALRTDQLQYAAEVLCAMERHSIKFELAEVPSILTSFTRRVGELVYSEIDHVRGGVSHVRNEEISSYRPLQFVSDFINVGVVFRSIDRMRYYCRQATMAMAEQLAEAEHSLQRIRRISRLAAMATPFAEMDMVASPDSATKITLQRHSRVMMTTTAPSSFNKGDILLLSIDYESLSPWDGYERVRHGAEVEVVTSHPDRYVVKLLSIPPEGASLDLGGYNGMDNMRKWRLDLLCKRHVVLRQIDALRTLAEAHFVHNPIESMMTDYKNRKMPHIDICKTLLKPRKEPFGPAHLRALNKCILTAADLNRTKRAVLESTPSSSHFQAYSVSGSQDVRNGGGRRDTVEDRILHDGLVKLNDSQRGGLLQAMTTRLTLIQGPPGTGKTHTAVQILAQMVRRGLAPQPLLATSDSNIAVDNLLDGLVRVGINAVRIGRSEKIRDDLAQYAVNVHGSKGKAQLKKAEVICCTCIGSGSDVLDKIKFHTVLIDEATQATETATVVPIMNSNCERLILVGDHCQLPPTVVSTEAQERGLAISLFTRLVSQGIKPALLDTQYRMHPSIAQFPSDSFYNKRLKNGVKSDQRRPPPTYRWPCPSMPVAFEPVERPAKTQATLDGDEERRGQSYYNAAEVRKVVDVVYQLFGDVDKSMFNPGAMVGPGDIGIVTPYSAQVDEVRNELRRLGFPVSRSRYFEDISEGAADNFIEVASVDGFQGREKEVIIFSAVRSNTTRSVGFLQDWRRLNVMITRARRGIIVIGDRRTLRYDNVWGTWISWAENRGLVRGEVAKRNGYVPRLLADTMLGDVSLEQYLNLEADDEVQVVSTTDGGWAEDGAAAAAAAAAKAGSESEEKAPEGEVEEAPAAPSVATKKARAARRSSGYGFADANWESLMDGSGSDSDSDSVDSWGQPKQAPAPAPAPRPVKTAPVVLKVVAPAPKKASPAHARGPRPVSPSQEKYFPGFVKNYDISKVPDLVLPLCAEEADEALQDESERLLLQSEAHHGKHGGGGHSLRHGEVKLLTKKKSKSDGSGKKHGSSGNGRRSGRSQKNAGLVLMKKSEGGSSGHKSSRSGRSSGGASSGDWRSYGEVRVLPSKKN